MQSVLAISLLKSFMPHGVCYLWTPGLVWLHVGSDALIALAYFVIPVALLYVVKKREDLPFNWLVVLFGIFIVACGMTHVMGIWNVWHGHYWISGGVKAVTALASIPTAILLILLIPRILSVPSRAQLEEANRRLEMANKELEQFAYAVSHDLRAPLRAIEGFGRALQDELQPDQQERTRHYLSRIFAASEHMAELIDDLLDLSRLAREHITYEEVDVSALAEETLQTLQESDPDRVVEWRVQPGMKVLGDRGLLRIAFENLLRNAWKFTGQQTQALVEVGEQRLPGGSTAYYVRDNGAGFDMRYADKLFAIFQRLHGTSEFPGNGVGLATVQRIVHRHGGDIWAESREGEGAKFSFTLS